MEYILLEDNPHWEKEDAYDHFIRREALNKAQTLLAAKEVIAIIGARRVGKSTLAKLMIAALMQEGIGASNIFFINLEKPAFIPFKEDASYLDKIFEEYLKLAEPNRDKRVYFFIDEVHIFQNWEVFVKSKYESADIKFVITGSNASLLTSNYATMLTGRVLKMQLGSFGFREFLHFKNIDITNRIKITHNRLAIQKAKAEYMKWGGYYSVIATDDEMLKKEILKNIAEDIILKDIVPRYKIKTPMRLKTFFSMLSQTQRHS